MMPVQSGDSPIAGSQRKWPV